MIKEKYEEIKEIERKISELTDYDSESIIDHACEQIIGTKHVPEWLRAIFESITFEQCSEDWSQFAECEITPELLQKVENQLNHELEELRNNMKQRGEE